jgi:hypothetical protein
VWTNIALIALGLVVVLLAPPFARGTCALDHLSPRWASLQARLNLVAGVIVGVAAIATGVASLAT